MSLNPLQLALDDRTTLSAALRATLASAMGKLTDADRQWLTSELNGYDLTNIDSPTISEIRAGKTEIEGFPGYRRPLGSLRANYPNGTQGVVVLTDHATAEALCRPCLHYSIAQIEDMIDKKAPLDYFVNPEMSERAIREIGVDRRFPLSLRYDRSSFVNILENVRNRLIELLARIDQQKSLSDREYMELAVVEARLSKSENGRSRPMVGAVVVRDGTILAKAHRGECKSGEHAEFCALERKLKDVALSGATVYTTLEPCTTRNHPKVPCVERLIDRKVARVVIGTLDPNPDISGKGQRRLREARIITDLFDHDLMTDIEELNRNFTRSFTQPGGSLHKSSATPNVADELATWHKARLQEITQLVESEFDPGPILVVHALPLVQNASLDLKKIEQAPAILCPFPRTLPGHGRVTRFGYELCRLSDSKKLISKGQAFKTGRLEGVIPIDLDGQQIYGMALDDGIVQMVQCYTALLAGQQVNLPYVFKISLLRVKDRWLTVQSSFFPHVEFQENCFTLQDITFTTFDQTNGQSAIAEHLKPALDELWQASGFHESASFPDGKWKVRK